ncbi:TadE/TadG family type IV pilus assembly protein [Sphingomonas sp.]|uniref:TadE/TadG family type IV pilus assembly protein n=1 Tax=Sphingomonas sp. TaxID=28214 RepID=UPI001DAEAB17|nr:TadE/TadG family type IV pilus assembly protein [Sphingomonas sp.]MBX9795662.1 pilus assembly protein [Sphingomonas sp.]
MAGNDQRKPLLSRLAADIRGNTLAIMAAAMVPLAGLVGGGIDMSRMYMTKTRLQHACDAGALAGRRAMGGGTWSQNNNYAGTIANQFFDGNFPNGSYGTTGLTRSFSERTGTVSGTASATVPMTLMRVLGQTTQTITVVCGSQMRLPNTDVMFVLDTTGSMGQTPSGDSQTKMASLKVAVKCFYEILARQNTNANCAVTTPGGGLGSQVQVRFGFVPYATNVNVGRLLQNGWMADSWNYQTRVANRSNGNFVNWTYRQAPINVSGLKAGGSNWNNSITAPTGSTGTNATITWDGCIEERQTVRTTDFDPLPAGAKDLDIDTLPNAADATTQWGPVLPGLIYTRWSGCCYTTANVTTTSNLANYSYYACPEPARKLQSWPVVSDFEAYVDSLQPEGNTYHDIGLLWGARLMSATGLFASENALTPSGGEIERHMLFMTDGDPCTDPFNYTAYGVNWYDRRQTDANSEPTGGCTSTGTMTEQVNLRTEALCTAIKNKNITLWVITFGSLDSTTVTRMTNCASPGRYYNASNAATLQTAFASIASQISQLRVTL